jgi:hypothetical protein
MIRIGVISDTHGLLRPEAERCLAGVSYIIHAGDIGASDVLERLRRIAPVTAIRGNVDVEDWARRYPDTATVRIGQHFFYVLHDLKELKNNPQPAGVHAVIHGHSHRTSIATTEGVLYLNPGSAGPRRFKLPITLATVDLSPNGRLHPIIHELEREKRP